MQMIVNPEINPDRSFTGEESVEGLSMDIGGIGIETGQQDPAKCAAFLKMVAKRGPRPYVRRGEGGNRRHLC